MPPPLPISSNSLKTQPLCDIYLWPQRSLSKRGYVLFMRILALAMLLLFLVLWGAPRLSDNSIPAALLFIAACMMLTYGGMVFAFKRNYAAARQHQRIRIWHDLARIEQWHAGRKPQIWEAATYWLHIERENIHMNTIPKLFLCHHRERIEIGAFLSETERDSLAKTLRQTLQNAKRH